ncbi:UNVERIFIED_CONTAM: Peroxidase 47 [Sesamum radiatum]|uniref:peroxidase n=1 Tax=Sesamum radiatum TaxID=300843 RepID=A0AAW2J3V1_SESRA
MHFHDCFVQGCDASILIDSSKDNTAEKDSPANLSLRGYEIIDAAKDALEKQCPGVVSCADILAMAARDAVFFAGGPVYDIPKGRKDGRRSKIEDTINLPPPNLNSSELIRMFGQRGFTPQQMVALSGDSAEQPFDTTRNTFDNDYFNALQRKAGVLFSDQTLFESVQTRGIVNAYAMNQAMFFFAFQQAMVKMGVMDVKEGSNGEVRNTCRVIN